MKNNTNYMRSVNDYSLSAHEIFNEVTGNRFPADVRVYTAKNVTAENFTDATQVVLQQFLNDGYEIERKYSINYEDGSDPGEESQYTIYEQFFNVLQKPWIAKEVIDNDPELLEATKGTHKFNPERTVVLEMYRRNNELIVLTLSPVSTKQYISAAAEIFRGRFKPKKKDKVFYTISASNQGFELEEMKIPTVYDETHVDLHYNDDFKDVHNTIIKHIDDDKKGLILLHGLPGSGKTSYIKQLISKGGTRKLVYIPPHLASSIASPQFITFVRDKLKSCVLVIEDAEEILHERGAGTDNTAVSNLLNISDGILGEALNILIIATFNREKSFIDKALMRKGRMICEYYFNELDMDKSMTLIRKLYGEDVVLTIPDGEQRVLANLFNMEVVQHRTKDTTKLKGGFGFSAG